MTDATPHPNVFVVFIMGLAGTLSVADDRVGLADWTASRQAIQWDHPRVGLVFRFWQCDKKYHGWREGRR